jgi:hypothetical protein
MTIDLKPFLGLLSKSYSEITDAEREVAHVEIEAYQARKPAAIERDDLPIFAPGMIFFVDGEYRGVSPDIETPWPWIERHMGTLLDMMPMRHRADHWRERIASGATVALAFLDSKDWWTEGAGILNCEMTDDGRRIVLVAVCTFEPLNLEHATRIAEVAGLGLGAEQVHLWTPHTVPMVAGYHIENCWFGQLQVAAVQPVQ